MIRKANNNDKTNVLSLLNDVFKKQQRSKNVLRDDRFWVWKYKSSPFGESLIHVAEDNNKIIASATLWSWEIFYNGNFYKCYQPCDTVVSGAARGKGFFYKINNERIIDAKKENTDFIFNFPNENSLPGYKKCGWTFVGKIPWKLKILKPLTFINSYFKKSQSEKIRVPRKFSLNHKNLQAIPYKSTPNNNKICTNISPDYVKWRYLAHPTRDYGIINVESQKKIVGSVIFTLSKKGNMVEMVLTEFICENSYDKKLIKKVIKSAREMGVTFIALMSKQTKSFNTFWQIGFLDIKNKNLVCRPLNSETEKFCLDIKNWSFSAGMHDSI